MEIRRRAHLRNDGVLAVAGVVRARSRQLEAVEIVPIVGAEEHVNRSGVILETAHRQSLLAKTQAPVGVDGVVDV